MTGIQRGAAFTAAQLAATVFEPPRYAVDGILAEGVNLLAGAPKLGKSWLALDFALAVSTGGRALGSIPVVEGDVLYLALEDTPRRLQGRMNLTYSGDWPERLTFLTDWPGNEEGFAYADEWLTERPGARLVVVDVLQKIRPSAVTNQNAYAADYGAMAPLMEMARKHQVCVLVVHHTRKASADDFLDTVSGTNGIAGAADATLVLARARNAADATLAVTGRDVEEHNHALAFHNGRWSMLSGRAEDYDLSEIRRQTLAMVREHGPIRPKALAAVLAHEYEATKKLCQRMVIDGQLSTDGSGHYSVPPIPLSLESPESPTEGQQGPEGHRETAHLEVVPDA